MADLEFLQARNATLTCSCNGFFLHSRFDPDKEAQRFVDAVQCSYNPSHIIVTGACMGYVVPYLKQRWPDAQLISIQYCPAFSTYDRNFDKTFIFAPETSELAFSESLFSFLGEEPAFSTLFLSWTPSEKVWQHEYSAVWSSIKLYMNKVRDVIGTRNYFNKRWLKNSVKFFSLTERHTVTKKQTKPIVICASGPTLKAVLPVITKNRNSFFLLCLSSALNALTASDVIPDAVLSTDGGWWATQHLKPLITDKRLQNVPLWVTSESAVPSELLKNHAIQYVSYGDTFETWLLSAIEGREQTFFPLPGIRNGTVSGTALYLASGLTIGNVYFCGLDLKSGKGHQHTQPNCLESRDSCTDCRSAPAETRIAPRTFPSGSLELYRNWFITRKPEAVAHCYRIISSSEQENNPSLGNIRDITPEELNLKLTQSTDASPNPAPADNGTSHQIRQVHAETSLPKILSSIKSMQSDNPVLLSFMKSAALSDYLQAVRNADSESFSAAWNKSMTVLDELVAYAEKLQEQNLP